ncbi:hypothetical protein GWI33_010806 [Rhynchophorus ferrugineus]|uniref:Acriflavin resistance protein n=1 Tax=Rhynchophorus ferrugineus TaxID=354439 RepID=A0A834IBZ5_RHYFE|nr:hypothetical protein GWI33_010806 [Rhynchophorus ferrugineus]
MERGEDRYHAILQAGKTRLRPILMTTSAMVMGMVPLALGLGEGGEQSAPMAHAVIGGVITSTLLTLIVVPVVFSYLDDLKNLSTQLFRRIFT